MTNYDHGAESHQIIQSCSSIQETAHILFNTKLQYRVHNNPNLVPILSRYIHQSITSDPTSVKSISYPPI